MTTPSRPMDSIRTSLPQPGWSEATAACIHITARPNKLELGPRAPTKHRGILTADSYSRFITPIPQCLKRGCLCRALVLPLNFTVLWGWGSKSGQWAPSTAELFVSLIILTLGGTSR
jgi:hypothetical protein